ncbi:MAG TPA: amino acid adenylation domain-containing protein [Thermoanaerobaculia bacterium]|nr:amino acid adenylation domain-containing protein [Thermoanaerobaculia bacterium]
MSEADHGEGNGLEIAIIGMAGRFPGADGIEQFWRNLRDGVESLTYLDAEDVPADLRGQPGHVPVARMIPDYDLFDAGFFSVNPREAEILDPQQRVFLECCWEALEDAGYDPGRVPGPVGVYAGSRLNFYLMNVYSRPDLVRSMGDLVVQMGNEKDYLATRVSYKLNLGGPSVTVQSACSTALVAVHLACQGLLSGECDMALAGGVSIRIPELGYVASEGGVSSPDGHIRPFDAKAGGTVFGSGLGAVVLRRLSDAVADGDTIHAVILGSAVTNDGIQKVGFTAPGMDGQVRVLRNAYTVADVDPGTLSYVEAHGTGTPVGDPIEVSALTRVFREHTEERGFCALGSVKANIGHLGAAAGIASLIKATLAMERREIPPSILFDEPNPQIDFASSPFFVNTELRPWESNGRPRRAGVSAYGMGGTNAHVVLQEAPPAEPTSASRPWQLLLLSARTETALETMTANLAAHLEVHPEAALADVAYTLQVGRKVHEHRRSVVCRDAEDARRALAGEAPEWVSTCFGQGREGKVAFLFSGQGAQYPGMGRGLYETEAAFRDEVDRCCELLPSHLGLDLRELLFAADDDAEAAERLSRTCFTQPALFVVEYALARLWMSWGIAPSAMLGHSIGEYVAACLAGVFSLEDALALVAERGRLMQSLPSGAMLAVPLPEAEVLPLLGAQLALAAVNAPDRCVVSGPHQAVDNLLARLTERNVAARPLHTSHAFHSHMMEPILAPFAKRLQEVELHAPALPYLSNVTGAWITGEEATDPAYWVRHLRQEVRFADGVRELCRDPQTVLLEVGPGRTLASLARQHPDRGTQRVVVTSLPHPRERQEDLPFALKALGLLWLAGVDPDWKGFHAGERRRRIPLPAYPFERRRFWIEPRLSPSAAVPAAAGARFDEPAPESPRAGGPVPAAFRSAAEARVAGVFEQLLGVAAGPEDDFFELGGDSLLATRLAARLREELDVQMSVQAVFDTPTVAGLAEWTEAAVGGAERAGSPTLAPLPAGAERPLSFAQERLWFLDRFQPGSSAYNIPLAVRLSGPLEPSALDLALGEIARRHEALRTTFPAEDGGPRLRVAPLGPAPAARVDLSDLPDGPREEEAARIAREEPRRGFDLAAGPLLRVTLVCLAVDRHFLCATIHHIVSDGWSLGVFARELMTLYRSFAAGRPSPLPELEVQYADFAAWQRRRLDGPALEALLAAARERLGSAPGVLELPTDRPRPAVETFRGGRRQVSIPPELAAALVEVGRARGATLFMTLLAAFQVLLHRLTGEEDLTVGTPTAGRTLVEVEGLVGLFINTLVLRTALGGNPGFEEALDRVRASALDAFAGAELPFEKLVKELRPERRLGHSPLFQAMFILQNLPVERIEAGNLALETLREAWHGVSRFDLTLSLTEGTRGLSGYLEFKADLFEDATAERWVGLFSALLTGIAEDPARRIADLPLLPDSERWQLLSFGSGAAMELPAGLVHQRIAERARRCPGAVAVSFQGEEWTRAELLDRAGRLARRLRAQGVGPGVLVAVCLERSLALPAALLGVLQAGGAYLPLDPSYPAERLAFMLSDSGASVVLTQESLLDSLPLAEAVRVLVDGDGPELDGPAPDPCPDDLAYVLYTSGSTGRPKGVEIPHGALANFLESMRREPGLAADDVLLAVTSLSFDIAGLELFLPLVVGARFEIVSAAEAADGSALARRLEASGATVIQATPSTWRMLLAAGWKEPRLGKALTGGEPLTGDLAARLLERADEVWNVYGPTETTVWSSALRVERAGTGAAVLPIGRPIGNTQLYVVDGWGHHAPVGVPGELWIGGEGVARGYRGRPALTAERFVPDPFTGGRPGARLYRTGDLVRRRGDGGLEFLGRIDHQVKVRGFRIELGEIESRLREHPEVAETVVVARGDRLVAYVVPAAEAAPAPDALREHLRAGLPEYMVPAVYVPMAALPLTPNRKVDRKALPDPGRGEAAAAYVAPGTPIEESLAAIWADLLRVERVGLDDDFFALGGHSLLATRLVSRLRPLLGEAPPVRWVFERPTLRGLAARVDEHREGPGLQAPPIEPVPRESELPLSFAQQRFWFLDRLEPGRQDNIPAALRLRGRVEAGALAGALTEIVRRHEVLRTTFPVVGGEPRQRILPPAPVPLPVVDLSGLPPEAREREAFGATGAVARLSFDLARGPLLAAALIRLIPEEEHQLAFSIHHIVSDGWSTGILMRELSALYAGLARGRRPEEVPLPELPVQYADYAVWQRRWISGENLERLVAGWRAQLDGVPATLDLPTDFPRPAVQSFRGGHQRWSFGLERTAGLKSLARAEGASLFMVLLAGFAGLLHRLSGQEEVVIGSPVAGRNREEIENLIGAFINMLPLRADLSGDPTVRELIGRVREVSLEAYALQDLPFERLLDWLQPARDLARPPLIQVMLVLQNAPRELLQFPGLTLEPMLARTGTARFELTLWLAEGPEGIGGTLEYGAALFEPATAARLAGRLSTILAGAAEDPDRRLSQLPLLPEEERRQVLVAGNDTDLEVPPLPVYRRFAEQARRTPGAVAVAFQGEELTYAALAERSGRLARRLRALGVRPGALVGLCVQRGLDLPVALLGLLEAGGAYLPLDPAFPADRLAFMLEDSGAVMILTQEHLAGALPESRARVVWIEDDGPEEEVAPGSGAGLDDLAYVLYTSGSTGRPKGVEIPHRAFASFLESMRREPGVDAGHRLLALTSLSFDIAGLELFLPLIVGGRIEIVSSADAGDGLALCRRLRESRVDVVQATPSTWRMLLEAGWREPRLGKALTGGEPLSGDLADRLRERADEVWNVYGPTETTVWSSVLRVEETAAVLPIGRPIGNTQLYVVDPWGNPAPVGVPGELLIGGEGVARGHRGRPALTAERFVPDPFAEGRPGARLYRTGDLARRRGDGVLEFLGRIDHQVKVRGFRIELGEIESRLREHPDVADAVVVAREDRLVAYVVPFPGAAPAPEALREHLRAGLPEYMVPAAYVPLATLPLTPNRKVDRKALPDPGGVGGAEPVRFEEPRTPSERRLAELWSEVLGVPRVGAGDDFFALGGHSIVATRLMFRIRERFGIDLPLRTLFSRPVLRALAEEIEASRAAGPADAGTERFPRLQPDPARGTEPFPLTEVQEAYWIGRSSEMTLGRVATHIYLEIDLSELDVDRLQRALDRLVRRHGMLRAIVEVDGRQRILPEVPPCTVPVLDLRRSAPAVAEAGLAAVRERMSHQVLPSDRWPLFEVAATLLDDRVRVHLSLDLLIADAWSFRILARDLAAYYGDPDTELPALEISFRDYVLAEASLRETAAWRRALDYWRGRLATLPPAPELPLAKSPAAVVSPRFVRRRGRLDRAAWERLQARARQAGVTPSALLLAAWAEVLGAWSRSPRLTVNLTLFNRLPLHPEVDELVGDFTSLTLLAVEGEPGEPFERRARRVGERLWDDLDHRLVGGVRVIRELSRAQGRTVLMPVVFTSTLNQGRETRREPAKGGGEGGYGISQTPQVWLDHQVHETEAGLVWNWDAVEELFPEGLLDAMLAAYRDLLARLADDEAAWREPVRGLLPAGQRELIARANATDAPAPEGLLHEPFLAQAERRPDATALVTSSRRFTYGDLDRASLALAYRLRRLGAEPNRLIAMVMEKGWEQVVAVLAVLRAGAAYLPIDAGLPEERVRHLLDRGEVAVALTQPAHAGRFPEPSGVAWVSVDDGLFAASAPAPLPVAQTPEDLAYVIFTSGSTGQPKGVMVEHRGALNTVIDVNERFAVGPGDRVFALSSLSFDLSVYDVFGLLAAGGTIVLPDPGAGRDPAHWMELAAREGATLWNSVPALMEMLVEYGAGLPDAPRPPLRTVLLSGDWIPVRLPDRIREAFPAAEVISLGGATEASIWSILYPIGRVGEGWQSIPYGHAMKNQRFHVLDDGFEPRPVWVPGHLHIGGVGLARGYWREEEKTRAAFVVHPRTGERLYRTGDLGRWLPDGEIEFLGREDTQVKVQGHRIELGEIEAVLAQHPAVSAAVVTAHGERHGPKQLVGYVVPADGARRPRSPGNGADRLPFKLERLAGSDGEDVSWAGLPLPRLTPAEREAVFLRRRTVRTFDRGPVPSTRLGAWLAGLSHLPVEGSPLPKLRYGSAGSLYPVQAYLLVKPERVEGVPGGVYAYDPAAHALARLDDRADLDAALFDEVNRETAERAAFALFLIARRPAIEPLYGASGLHYAVLEAGLMTQLLETEAPDYGLALAQAGGIRFEPIRDRFDLEGGHELIHVLLGGGRTPDASGRDAFLADLLRVTSAPAGGGNGGAPASSAAASPLPPAVIADPMERLRFKLSQPGLRRDEGRPRIPLERPPLGTDEAAAAWFLRRSYRRFRTEPVPLEEVSQLLGSLSAVEIEGAPFPKRRYGSAGGLYPVEAWLYVKPGRVARLAGGTWRYDARRHRLVLLREDVHIAPAVVPAANRRLFEDAAFVLFLVARRSAIEPLYGVRAGRYAALEAGLMTQLLETEAPGLGIGLTQIGGARFADLRASFHAEDDHELVHALAGGRIGPEQIGRAAWLAESAAEAGSSVSEDDEPAAVRRPPALEAPARPGPAAGGEGLLDELREFLRSRLPEYMVPPHLMEIETLPLSPNGKVDRAALPRPEAPAAQERPARAPFAPPKTELERLVATSVAGVLGVERVGLHDNFFDIGATSVHVVRVHNDLRRALGVEISMMDLFNHPAVSLLARHLAGRVAGGGAEAPAPAEPSEDDRAERLQEGKDWRRQRLQKRRELGR